MKRRSVLLLGMLFLMVGFAAVTSTLVINGNARIASNDDDFDVYFSASFENGKKKNSLIKDDTHIVFDYDISMVGETYTLEYDVTNGSREYDASVSINCTNSTEYLGITNEFDEETNLLATETRKGTLKIELIKAYAGETTDVEVTCEIVGSAVSREEVSDGTPADKVKSAWEITEDNDNNGEVSVGDLITLGSESFYVYNIEGDNISAIARYNLHVGGILADESGDVTPIENPTGLQDPSSKGAMYEDNGATTSGFPWSGVVPYTTEEKYNQANEGLSEENKLKPNNYGISVVKEYVDEYATKLAELDGEVKTTRLITKEELESVGCDPNKYSCKAGYNYNNMTEDAEVAGAPEYMYTTSYWTSSPYEGFDDVVWYVRSIGGFGYDRVNFDGALGVRPVIEISKSLF